MPGHKDPEFEFVADDKGKLSIKIKRESPKVEAKKEAPVKKVAKKAFKRSIKK